MRPRESSGVTVLAWHYLLVEDNQAASFFFGYFLFFGKKKVTSTGFDN
jgi:hypothetical protein